MQRLICVLVVLTAPILLRGDDDDVRKELKALQGKWKAVSLETGGHQMPKDAIPEFTYTIGHDGKAIGKMAQGEYLAAMTVNPRKNPKTIDNLHESGSSKGKKQFGVYKLEGDKLTVCMTAPGAMEANRPKDFNTKGNANAVFVFERVKEDK